MECKFTWARNIFDVIPETDDSELLKAAVLALPWGCCSWCHGPNQQLCVCDRGTDAVNFWPLLCVNCSQRMQVIGEIMGQHHILVLYDAAINSVRMEQPWGEL
jgi:hypothetical protein